MTKDLKVEILTELLKDSEYWLDKEAEYKKRYPSFNSIFTEIQMLMFNEGYSLEEALEHLRKQR